MEHENRWETEEIARQVRGAVSDMLESLRLGPVNQVVKDTAGSVLEDAKIRMEQYRNRVEDAKWRRQKVASNPQPAAQKPLEIRVNLRGKVSGILFTIFGGMGSVVFGIVMLATAAIRASFHLTSGIGLLRLCGILIAAFCVMMWKGICQSGRVSRLKAYVEELKHQGKTYCELEKLSRSSGKPLNYVRKDLKTMLRLGMLPDARMDEESRWLLLDEETYRQYRLFYEAAEEKKRISALEEKEREKKEDVQGVMREETPVDAAIRQGEEYMESLEGLLADMEESPIREKLLRLKRILERLFVTLRKYPKQLDEMERFMSYYLPTTVKLVATYQEFAAVEFAGENIGGAKREIEEALDIINGAFEKFVDDLYGEAAMDIITDASVLKTMLAKEGMTEEPGFTRSGTRKE